MNSRIFGKTGRLVSEIGLGTWQLGAGWGEVTDDAALATLRAAYESGTSRATHGPPSLPRSAPTGT